MLDNDSGDYPSVRNCGSVEEIFLKASRIENLGLGLVFFVPNTFKEENGFLTWVSLGAKETLQTQMKHILRLLTFMQWSTLCRSCRKVNA
ncbi:hypothetical protein BDR06DRAFT_965045 [Suillus hirtellus]|nr:hypothetical protein BDR06DRAFT_965045 [Suillus hirtellus]